MRVVLAPSKPAADIYMHRRSPFSESPRYVFADSAADLVGACPDEIHVVAGANAHPRAAEIAEALLVCEAKMPLRAMWWLNGRLVPKGVALVHLGVKESR